MVLVVVVVVVVVLVLVVALVVVLVLVLVVGLVVVLVTCLCGPLSSAGRAVRWERSTAQVQTVPPPHGPLCPRVQ